MTNKKILFQQIFFITVLIHLFFRNLKLNRRLEMNDTIIHSHSLPLTMKGGCNIMAP